LHDRRAETLLFHTRPDHTLPIHSDLSSLTGLAPSFRLLKLLSTTLRPLPSTISPSMDLYHVHSIDTRDPCRSSIRISSTSSNAFATASASPAATKDSIYDAPVGRKAEEPKATAQPVPKRRRHNSPSSGSPQPSRDPGPSVAPRPANTKPAKPRPSVPTAAPIRTTTAAVREEAKRSRPATPTRLDGPTLTQAPRVGMGEVYPPPPESDIRKEAQYIIDAAARHRERERQRSRELPFHDEKVNGRARNTPPPTGDPAYPYPPYPMNGHSNGQRLLTTNGGRASLHYATAGPSSYTVQPGSRPSTATESHTKPPSYPQPVDDSFEEEYAAVQSSYDKLAEANIASMEESIPHSRPIMAQDEPRQPHFHEEQRPTIVLAPNGGGKAKIRDKVERAHQEGYEGLTPEHVVDAFGFVENVRVSAHRIHRSRLMRLLPYFLPAARIDFVVMTTIVSIISLVRTTSGTSSSITSRNPARDETPFSSVLDEAWRISVGN